MKLWVVCQLCGKKKKIDTQKPTKWWNYKIGDIIENELWNDYDIWVCPTCVEKYVVSEDAYYYDDSELIQQLRESLR